MRKFRSTATSSTTKHGDGRRDKSSLVKSVNCIKFKHLKLVVNLFYYYLLTTETQRGKYISADYADWRRCLKKVFNLCNLRITKNLCALRALVVFKIVGQVSVA